MTDGNPYVIVHSVELGEELLRDQTIQQAHVIVTDYGVRSSQRKTQTCNHYEYDTTPLTLRTQEPSVAGPNRPRRGAQQYHPSAPHHQPAAFCLAGGVA